MTSTVSIKDECLWFKHIEGNPTLSEKLSGLRERELVVLKIDGVSSVWRRMDQGKNENPTPGLKPACDLCSDWWRELYKTRKGERVRIALADR